MSLSLEDVRTRAKEKLKGVCMVYRDCDGDPSRFCQGNHYGRPIGIGGIGSGASFHNNWLALRRINIKTKLVENHEAPDTTFDFFGNKLSMPIIGRASFRCRFFRRRRGDYRGGVLRRRSFGLQRRRYRGMAR